MAKFHCLVCGYQVRSVNGKVPFHNERRIRPVRSATGRITGGEEYNTGKPCEGGVADGSSKGSAKNRSADSKPKD